MITGSVNVTASPRAAFRSGELVRVLSALVAQTETRRRAAWLVGELDPDNDLPPCGTVLRLDYDRARLPRDSYRRIVAALRWLRLRPLAVVYRKTARGWHVKIAVGRRCSPLVVVALQAILGSDPKRETFNLVRARTLPRASPEWRNRYSVLFGRKL